MNSSKLLRHISKSVRQQIMPSSNLSAFREEFKEAKHGMIFNFTNINLSDPCCVHRLVQSNFPFVIVCGRVDGTQLLLKEAVGKTSYDVHAKPKN